MRVLCLLMGMVLFAGCSARANGKSKSVAEVENKTQVSANWISQEYLDCLDKDLPCDCINAIEYILVQFNVDSPSEIKLVEPRLNEEELIIKASENGVFNVYTYPEAISVFLSFTISGDTMVISSGGETKKYIRYAKFNEKLNGVQLLGKLNIVMLKRLLSAVDFDIEEKLNIIEESQLHCNVELGYLNLLYSKGDCNNKWIIEKDKEKVLIYKYVNSCEGKTYPIVVDKELVYTIPVE